MEEKYKKKITQGEYLQIEGLMALAHEATKQLTRCDEAMASILDYKSEYTSDCGLLSDRYFDDGYNVKATLKDMEVEVLNN